MLERIWIKTCCIIYTEIIIKFKPAILNVIFRQDFNFTIYPNIIPLYQVNNSLYQILSQKYTIDKEEDNVFIEINYITKGQLVLVNFSFYLSYVINW